MQMLIRKRHCYTICATRYSSAGPSWDAEKERLNSEIYEIAGEALFKNGLKVENQPIRRGHAINLPNHIPLDSRSMIS